jgi:hypothetical protein
MRYVLDTSSVQTFKFALTVDLDLIQFMLTGPIPNLFFVVFPSEINYYIKLIYLCTIMSSKEKINCRECKTNFSKTSNLRAHVKRKHPSTEEVALNLINIEYV